MAPPVAPSYLNAGPSTSTTIALDWEFVAGSLGVEIERGPSALGPFTLVFTTGDNPPAYTDTGLAPLTTYYYRVRVCNGDGCGPYSPVASDTTLDATDTAGYPLYYRLRVRNVSTQVNPNGTADVLIVTSWRSGDTPYIAEPPEGDGQEIDLLTGGVRTGSYIVRVIDAPYGSDGTGILRYVTGRLEDAQFRQQLLSRRAYIETSPDGTTWEGLHAGYVTNLRLASAISYAFTIGDTRRVETQRKSFTWSAEPGPIGVSERDVFPGRGCLLGGPIIGGFGPVNDLGGDEYGMPYDAVDDTVFPGRKVVYLANIASYMPPNFERSRNLSAIGTYMNTVLQPYAEEFTQAVGVSNPVILEALDFDWRWYPKLTVQISDGVDTWYGLLRAAVSSNSPPILCALLDEAGSASPPSPGSYRVRVFKAEVGEDSPIYIDMHPVDIVTSLFDTVGIEWDSVTADAVKDALNPDLRYAMRITEPVMMLDFLTRSVFGPFGFSIRTNVAGQQEFYTTRLLSDAEPLLTIRTDDLTGDAEPIFSLDEGSIVSAFKISYQTFSRTSLQLNSSPPPPPDGIVVAEVPVIIQNADISVFSTREVEYVFPGFVHLAGSWASRMGDLIGAITILGFDRYGRGAPDMEASILKTSEAYAAGLGDEVYLDVAHYPNRGYRIGESDVGARIAQIVRRTITPYGALLKLVDSGVALQPVSPDAEISIEASAGSPRTVAQFTIDNAASINSAAVLTVAIEWAISSSEPTTAGQVFIRYVAGACPTAAVQLPPVAPSSRVWARARTEQLGRRPSAWSAWVDVTLSAFGAPTGVTISGITAESFDVAWTPSDISYWTEVFIAPGATPPADWSPYRVNLFRPGSNQTVIRGLDDSTAYIVGVCHRDLGTGERTTVATDTDTTTSNGSTAPTPIAVQVISIEQDASQPTGIAIGIWPADESFDIEIQRAADSGGSPSVFATIARVAGTTQVYRDLLPSDGLTRWYRVRHVLPGFDPSNYTGADSGEPGACPVNLNRPSALQPILTITVTPGDPDYVIDWSGVGTVEVSINGGAFGAPAASPITVTRIGTVITYNFRAQLNGLSVFSLVTIPVSTATTPAITAVNDSEQQAIACGVNWIVQCSWTTTNPNDTDYKIVVRDFTSGVIVADNQTTASSYFDDDTGEVGDSAFTGVTHTRRYTVELVRLSDNTIIDGPDATAGESVVTGAAC